MWTTSKESRSLLCVRILPTGALYWEKRSPRRFTHTPPCLPTRHWLGLCFIIWRGTARLVSLKQPSYPGLPPNRQSRTRLTWNSQLHLQGQELRKSHNSSALLTHPRIPWLPPQPLQRPPQTLQLHPVRHTLHLRCSPRPLLLRPERRTHFLGALLHERRAPPKGKFSTQLAP